MIVDDVCQYLLSAALLVKETHVWLSVEIKYILFSPSLSFKENFTWYQSSSELNMKNCNSIDRSGADLLKTQT